MKATYFFNKKDKLLIIDCIITMIQIDGLCTVYTGVLILYQKGMLPKSTLYQQEIDEIAALITCNNEYLFRKTYTLGIPDLVIYKNPNWKKPNITDTCPIIFAILQAVLAAVVTSVISNLLAN